MTSGSLLSNHWYRVAPLRPKLRPHARLHRHRYRGRVWYLLHDPASGRTHRFTPAARSIIACMDGRQRVSDLWEAANRRLGEDAPTQDELIQLLGQLHGADLLQSNVTPDVAELFDRGEREDRARAVRSYANPMALRFSLWDPERFLRATEGLARWIWGRWGAMLWLLVVVPALLLVPAHWPELTNDFSDRVLSFDNLITLYLVFPLLKTLHELGHATATKARGGEVHDLGIITLVLLPVPYVDASSATAFHSKWSRALVGAAGVGVELFVAALAFYLWLLIEPGFVRAVLFNVMIVAGVSTLIFNGNPLLRYDAYYVLADLIEMPNLASRASHYLGYLAERHLLGVEDLDPPDASRSEKVWFLLYGVASAIYRVLVTVFIALFIAGRFFVVGVLLALWAVGAMALFPLFRAVRHLATSPRLRRRGRAFGALAGLAGLVATFVLFVPVPYHTNAEGVVWLSEESLVHAGANGFLRKFLVPPGTRVAAGDPLLRCEDPSLKAQTRESEAKVAELRIRLAGEAASGRAKAEIAREKLRQEQETLATLRTRAADLTVRAGTDGTFMAPQAEDMPGRYYRKGDLLGYVIGRKPPLVRVVIPQYAVDKVRFDSERVALRVVGRPGLTLAGRIVRAVPAGGEYLPSPALSVEGGGRVATDPRDPKGPKSLHRMFQFDIALREPPKFRQFGQRVYVRFTHEDEPLSVQWYRSVRLLFLSRFSV